MSEIFFNESSSGGGFGVAITDEFDILKYVNENDPFNSYLLYILPSIDTTNYTITKYAGRIDLLAEEIFGDSLFYSILIFLNPYSKFEIKEIIRIITKDELSKIFQNVQKENEIAKSFTNDI